MNCNAKKAVYMIMCDACGMQYVGQTSNVRSQMNRHKSDYQRFHNGNFSKSNTSALYCHLKSHGVEMLKLKFLDILETECLKYNNNCHQLKTNLDAK